jgi:hypothetical protein
MHGVVVERKYGVVLKLDCLRTDGKLAFAHHCRLQIDRFVLHCSVLVRLGLSARFLSIIDMVA